jgi:hypothetical protein
LEKSGTKAALNAPSANNRRKRFGKAEGGVEGVRHRAGAERGRHQRFAGEAEDTAAERRTTDRCELS